MLVLVSMGVGMRVRVGMLELARMRVRMLVLVCVLVCVLVGMFVVALHGRSPLRCRDEYTDVLVS